MVKFPLNVPCLRLGEISLEQIESFSETKEHLEARITKLDLERNSLTIQIPVLKEKLTALRLEEKARSLENEISALHSEKALIEEEISRYDSGISMDTDPNSAKLSSSDTDPTSSNNTDSGNPSASTLNGNAGQPEEVISKVENQRP